MTRIVLISVISLWLFVIPLNAGKTVDPPIIEMPVTDAKYDFFVVLLSGDGGWTAINKHLSSRICDAGIPVVGFNSLKYFLKRHPPDNASTELDGIITRYRQKWHLDGAVLMGYSFGADVLPFMVTRLPGTTSGTIRQLVFICLSSFAEFQFHFTDWFTSSPGDSSWPVLPEIEKLKGIPMLYFYGTDEKENLSAEIDHDAVRVIPLKGDHHFDGKYRPLADSILTSITGQYDNQKMRRKKGHSSDSQQQ